ncbi:MAG: 1-deoxy-D-xylulose-5-phosphate reductoisomerase, partial [Glaciecola sp.]
MQTISILGSTGSIGTSTIDVIARHPEQYQVYALTAHRDYQKLLNQAQAVNAKHVVLSDESVIADARDYAVTIGCTAQLHFGATALETMVQADEVNTVMAAIVGAAGLLPTLAAVEAGKRVLLANKEALVMSGQLFIESANRNNATILPIDSEHNAIFQCLPHDFTYGEL